MAVKVQFRGFVNDIKQFDWGVIYNMAHSQRQKDEQGEWQTTGYDYFDVVDNSRMTSFVKGDQVEVSGNLKTRRYEGKDGVQRIALQVRADSMDKVRGQARGPAAVTEAFPGAELIDGGGWPEPKQAPVEDTEIPF